MGTGSEAPPFWWDKPDWRAWMLWPLSTLYGTVARFRMATARSEKVPAAVLCVGNLSVGGEGKTPLAIALAKEARRLKLKPGFLSRGYGGSLSHPHLVDTDKDTARLVGDEPLLLARHAPTVVTADRAAGARRLIKEGCDFIVMDDGFQSARLHMDYALIALDAARGIGNGHVIPGGPLRAPLVEQLRRADALVTMGEGEGAAMVVRRAARAGKPIYAARVRPRGRHGLKGKRVLAFAGIGNPDKFYDTLRAVGAEVVATRSFPDHYPLNAHDAKDLLDQAARDGLQLVTTEKDLARLGHGHGGRVLEKLVAATRPLPVDVVFETPDTPARIVETALEAYRERALS